MSRATTTWSFSKRTTSSTSSLPDVGVDPAAVGDLTAALGVERRLGELDGHAPVGQLAAGADHGEDLEPLVADERHGEAGVVALELLELAGTGVEGARPLGGAGALALLLHEVLEALLVDAHVPLRGDLAGEVEGEAVGVVELEGDLGRQLRAGVAGAPQRLVEDAHALLQGVTEADLLLADHAHDLGARRHAAAGRRRPSAPRRSRRASPGTAARGRWRRPAARPGG